jgi:hypothetical protein
VVILKLSLPKIQGLIGRAGGGTAIMLEAQQMIRAGFDVASEPYLKSILLCLRAHLLQVTFTF